MNDPLPISVIIPAYEAATSIAAAIASVRAQTRLPSEIVVIDDGSADGTAEVARSLGAIVFTQKNAGVGAARNTGIRIAKHPWIALLDADDRWLPDKLEAQWKALTITQDALCATDFVYVHADGTRSAAAVLGNRGYAKVEETTVAQDVAHLGRGMLARALPYGMFLLPSTLLFERRIVTEHAEWFLERTALETAAYYHLAEDTEWFLRILRRTDVALVKRVLTEYLVVPGSLSSNAGRMRYGDAKLGEIVCADPARYADGSAAEMRRLRGPRLREAVLEFLRRLEFDAARVVARESYSEGRRPLDALLLVVSRVLDCDAAGAIAHGVRFIWRRRRKPTVATPRPSAR